MSEPGYKRGHMEVMEEMSNLTRLHVNLKRGIDSGNEALEKLTPGIDLRWFDCSVNIKSTSVPIDNADLLREIIIAQGATSHERMRQVVLDIKELTKEL